MSRRISIVPGGTEGGLVLQGRRARDLENGGASTRKPRLALRDEQGNRRGRRSREDTQRRRVGLLPNVLLR